MINEQMQLSVGIEQHEVVLKVNLDYYEYPGYHSVRRQEGVATKDYKLIRFYGEDLPNGEEWEFYDLKEDPSEMENIYNSPKQTHKIKQLKDELTRLRIQYKITQNK